MSASGGRDALAPTRKPSSRSTRFPLAEASSFDPDVAATDDTIAARESIASGIKQIYSPMVDVSHEPRWGRIAEGAGEDRFLGSVMAATRVRAAQSDDYSKPDKVVTSPKHLAAYGQPEGGREYNTTDMSEQRLRNMYLPCPRLSARRAACGASAARPWPHGPVGGFTGGHARSSATAVKSLSMKPSKPHSFLRIWVSVSGFAQPGTVLMALMEHIDVSAPASTAALTSPPRATSPAGRWCC